SAWGCGATSGRPLASLYARTAWSSWLCNEEYPPSGLAGSAPAPAGTATTSVVVVSSTTASRYQRRWLVVVRKNPTTPADYSISGSVPVEPRGPAGRRLRLSSAARSPCGPAALMTTSQSAASVSSTAPSVHRTPAL